MLKVVSTSEYLNKLSKHTVSVYLQKQKNVQTIIDEVVAKGDDALLKYAREFDGIETTDFSLQVSEQEIKSAIQKIPLEMKSIIDEAYQNITFYHQKQKDKSWNFVRNGSFLGQLVNPVEKVMAYVPGGAGIYVSSVLMNCVPAQIAEVPDIYIANPPTKSGLTDPSLIYAAHLCGVKGIFKIGGAGAIAAFTYGTQTVPKVYKIVGPGNLYVTTAKKMVYGEVDIDMIAGPSEIMILADSSSNIDYITYDLFSQSEHDTDSSSIVLVPDKSTADKIIESVNEKVQHSKRQGILTEALSNNGYIVIYNSLKEAYQVINEYAPEHLEILLDIDYPSVVQNIKNVGSIFLGNYTPEPIGDYFAGANHSLPTGGTAKFYSPLGVYDFQKRTSVIKYTKERFFQDQDKVIQFAEYEGFYEHANSVRIRKK